MKKIIFLFFIFTGVSCEAAMVRNLRGSSIIARAVHCVPARSMSFFGSGRSHTPEEKRAESDFRLSLVSLALITTAVPFAWENGDAVQGAAVVLWILLAANASNKWLHFYAIHLRKRQDDEDEDPRA